MPKKIIGQKIEMSQVFADNGRVRPVTLVKVAKDDLGDFKKGASVKITGVSKGKGFTGVMKRWGFSGGPATHGQSDRARAPGSIGGGTDPGRVYKGKKMPGRAGGKTVTIKKLEVIDIDEESGVVKVSGPVPGARGGKVELRVLK